MDPEVVEAMMEAVVENRRLLVRVCVGSSGARSTLPSAIILPLHTRSLLMYRVCIVVATVGPRHLSRAAEAVQVRVVVVGILICVVRALLGFFVAVIEILIVGCIPHIHE